MLEIGPCIAGDACSGQSRPHEEGIAQVNAELGRLGSRNSRKSALVRDQERRREVRRLGVGSYGCSNGALRDPHRVTGKDDSAGRVAA